MVKNMSEITYYERRRRAFRMVTDLYSQGIDEDTIVFTVKTNYGLSRKFVRESINDIEKAKAVKDGKTADISTA